MAGIRLTPSSIELFEGCPLLFKLSFVDGRKSRASARSSPQLSLGNSVHDCLYLFHKEGAHGRHGPAQMEWLLKRSWVAGGYASREQEQQAWDQALEMVRGYHLAFADEPVEHLGSEAYLKASLNVRSTPVALSGKIDRLSAWPDGRLEVVDYKTGDEAEPGPTKLAGKLTTFLYYVLALLNHPKASRVEVSYIYLRTMTKVTAVYDPATGADCKDRLAQAVDQIAAGEFPARPNQRCAWCDFPELCSTNSPEAVDLATIL